MKFVINGFYENDAAVKAAEYCAKLRYAPVPPEGLCVTQPDSVVKAFVYLRKLGDLEGTCLQKAQLKFISIGFYENDAVLKAAEYCAKANVRKDCARACAWLN